MEELGGKLEELERPSYRIEHLILENTVGVTGDFDAAIRELGEQGYKATGIAVSGGYKRSWDASFVPQKLYLIIKREAVEPKAQVTS